VRSVLIPPALNSGNPKAAVVVIDTDMNLRPHRFFGPLGLGESCVYTASGAGPMAG